MRTNFIVTILATIMVASSLAVAMDGSLAGHYRYVPAAPQLTKGATEVGNLYIYANGTVSNSSAVQQIGTSNTYDLLANINGTLYIQRNNTVLEGNSLVINGESGTGLIATNVTGLAISHIAIIGSKIGIWLTGDQNTLVSNVIINDTAAVSMTMIHAYYSGNITIHHSSFIMGPMHQSTYGIEAEYDTSVNVSYNYFSGATTGIYISAYQISQLYEYSNTILSTYS